MLLENPSYFGWIWSENWVLKCYWELTIDELISH
jgi:hypothetical protein